MEVIQRNTIFNFSCQSRWAVENIIGFLKKLVSSVVGFLKNIVYRIIRFLYNSRKIVFFIIVVVLVALLFSFLIASMVNNDANKEENDRTISTTGTISVRDLELYGGDIESDEFGNVYIDWGELTLGASKNASFYVRSNRKVVVELRLNVTNWLPAGIEDYIDIFWDYNGTLLGSGPDQVPLMVTVNLDVSSSWDFIDFIMENEVTSFGFDMTVYASGV